MSYPGSRSSRGKGGVVTCYDLGGVCPVLQTPFDTQGQIDHAALAAEVDWVFSQGGDGVVVGMVSEILRLTDNERREVAATVCKATDGRGPVVISVTSEAAVVAQALAVHAASVGACAVMAAPPVTAGGASETEIESYYAAILSQVDIPVVVQDASGYVGRPLPLDLQAGLFDSWGPRVLFKPEAPPVGLTIGALIERCGPKACVFEGLGGVALVESYERGVVGTMPGADVCWAVVAVWEALRAGDLGLAYDIVERLGSLLALQSSLDAFVSVEKYLLVRQGVIPEPTCRGPLDFVPDTTVLAEIDRRFDRLASAVTAAASGGDRRDTGSVCVPDGPRDAK